MDFDQALEQFVSYLQSNDRSQMTIRGYCADLRQFARWFEQTNGQQPDLAAITSIDVREYRAYMQNVKGCGPATVNRHLRSLRAFCHWAVQAGHMPADPTAGLKEMRKQRLGPKALTRQEIYRLLRTLEERVQWYSRGGTRPRAIKAVRDMAMVTLLLHTGLRVSELAALKLSDVEISARKGILTVAGKGNKQRQIPLNNDARKALRRWLEIRSDGGETLFINRNGAPLGVRGIQDILTSLGRQAGVEGLHPHILRHTFATRYLETNPGDLVGLAAILGHESLNTLRIYTMPNRERMAESLERIATSD